MTLFIDTSDPEVMLLSLKDKASVIASRKIKARQRQGEKLVPVLAVLLQRHNLSAQQIKKIEVVVEGASFTSLRIGVVAANALAYALNVPVVALRQDGSQSAGAIKKFGRHTIAVPQYSRQPDIGQPKKPVLA